MTARRAPRYRPHPILAALGRAYLGAILLLLADTPEGLRFGELVRAVHAERLNKSIASVLGGLIALGLVARQPAGGREVRYVATGLGRDVARATKRLLDVFMGGAAIRGDEVGS